MKADPPSDVDRARELLEASKLQQKSDRMLAEAQVHATLAVQTAVRDLIASSSATSMATELSWRCSTPA